MQYAHWIFYILTFGCKVNQYESQALREAWTMRGGCETDDSKSADIVLLNTCAITANAVADARQAISRLYRENPNIQIIVTGCASEVAREEFTPLPGVIGVLGQKDKPLLLEKGPFNLFPSTNLNSSHVFQKNAYFPGVKTPRVFPPFSISKFRRARPVLKVQDGCSHKCSYCIVPFTRGMARSRQPSQCLTEIKRLLEAGYREIMISGINLRQYSFSEENCKDFWELISFLDRELAPEWGNREDCVRLRISSLDPAQLNPSGLETLASTSIICPHLHLSLQSGSPKILHAMRRGHYTPEKVIEAIKSVSSFWPRLGLGADFLMGFPGETEENVNETLDLIQALPLTYAHVFPFSSRPGTVAASMPSQINKIQRQQRAGRVRAAIREKQRQFWNSTLMLEKIWIALDCKGEEISLLPAQHGVDAWYTPCELAKPIQKNDHTLIPARPIGINERGILVLPI